jgi:hypothetical protein
MNERENLYLLQQIYTLQLLLLNHYPQIFLIACKTTAYKSNPSNDMA